MSTLTHSDPTHLGPYEEIYLRLTGKIERIFSLANPTLQGECINGHYSFQPHLDIELDLIDDGLLYCLPVLVRNENATITECLLLKRLKPDASKYTRVGLLRVSLDPKHTLPQEIRWIAEYANSDPDSRDVVKVTTF
jgi:hypothetical protein